MALQNAEWWRQRLAILGVTTAACPESHAQTSESPRVGPRRGRR